MLILPMKVVSTRAYKYTKGEDFRNHTLDQTETCDAGIRWISRNIVHATNQFQDKLKLKNGVWNGINADDIVYLVYLINKMDNLFIIHVDVVIMVRTY